MSEVDLLIAGGTVVTPSGRRRANVAVRDGRIAFILARDIGAAFVARDLDLAAVHALLAEALAERAA